MQGRRNRRRGAPAARASRKGETSGWTLSELAKSSGVGLRTLRKYLQLGLNPRVPFRGRATRYERVHQLRVLAIRKLQKDGLSLEEIRTRLYTIGLEQLERFVAESMPDGAPGRAAHYGASDHADGVQRAEIVHSGDHAASVIGTPGPRWIRIEVALGLELHVREDASRETIELACRFRELCASAKQDEAARRDERRSPRDAPG